MTPARHRPDQDLSDPAQVETLRQRVSDVLTEAEGDALVLAELVLVAMTEPQDLPTLLDAAQLLLAAALRTADEQEDDLAELRRRLADLQRPQTH